MSVIISCTVIIHICICRNWFRVTLLANFDFFLCLHVKFHKSLFWVPILAAGGLYWVPISQIFGSLYQSMEVPISFGDSAIHRTLHEGFRWCYSQERSIIRGAFKSNFWIFFGILSQLRGTGSANPNFFKPKPQPNKGVILLGFCCNRAGFPSPNQKITLKIT